MYTKIIPKIDLVNAPTCLACPLAECVYMLPKIALIRQACPVWRRETDDQRETQRRWRERRRDK